MANPYVYEGTAEEIATQIRISQIPGRLWAVIIPENERETSEAERSEKTLAERLEGCIGRFDFGDANLTEETEKKTTI